MDLVQAETSEQTETARELFREYQEWLGISLCFQNFDDEVANLPGDYRMPNGRLLIAIKDGDVVGCIALRKLTDDACEMKRLFLRPQFRGQGLGREMVQRIIDEAREIGYERMRLDTLPRWMDKAIALYEQFGFRDIPPYYDNPVAGARFMELIL